MKRSISLILAIVLCLSLLPLSAWAEEERPAAVPPAEDTASGEGAAPAEDAPDAPIDPAPEEAAPVADGAVSGICGDNLTWTLSPGGILTISGTGEMTDYTEYLAEDPPWLNSTAITSIVIADGVTSVGNCAFKKCSSLKSVRIGSRVESIGDSAFEDCPLLGNVTLPDGLKRIGAWAFRNCTSMTAVTIPDSVETMMYTVFAGCTSLAEVTFGSGLKKIENMMFEGCSSLESVTIPDGVETIGSWTFQHCTSLKSVTIPDSVTAIGGTAFAGCSSLTSVRLSNSMTSIASACFSNCSSLESVTIPAGITTVKNSAFYKCDALKDVFYEGSEEAWQTLSDNIEYGNTGLVNAAVHTDSTGPAPTPRPDDPGSGDDREPVTESSGTFFFRSTANEGSDTEASYHYNDDFFSHRSWTYDHDLARMSLCMALAAYNCAGDDKLWQDPASAPEHAYDTETPLDASPAKNVVSLMTDCGFSRIRVNKDYLITTTYTEGVNDGNNIGVCIGSKALEDDYTLIAVAIRGGGYGDEWVGDFNIYGSGAEHKGFEIAKETVLKNLREYVEENGISGNVKVWLCGYSRAAATADLVAASLCRNELEGTDLLVFGFDVYAYTFETPQGSKLAGENSSLYDGIWNIVNPVDMVPQVAMSAWDYGRYGHTVFLPCKYVNRDVYESHRDAVLERFQEYADYVMPFLPQFICQNYVIGALADGLAALLGSDGSPMMEIAQYEIQYIFKYDHPPLGESILVAVPLALLAIANTVGTLAAAEPVIAGAVSLAYGHYPELCLAWMDAVNNVSEDGTIRYAVTNCPVDLAVYDESGALQLRIVDDEVIMEDGAYIEAMVDWDGQKVICVPEDVEISIEVTATGDGEFNYSVQEYGLAADAVTKTVNYYDIPIAKGDGFTATVSEAAASDYALYDGAGEKLTPDETLVGGDAATYTVTVTAEGPGAASGTAAKTRGSFAQAVAEPEEGASFLGWYVGDELVSTETEYRFAVTENVALTAVFSDSGIPEDADGDGAVTAADAAKWLADHRPDMAARTLRLAVGLG